MIQIVGKADTIIFNFTFSIINYCSLKHAMRASNYYLSLFQPDQQHGDVCRADAGNTACLADGHGANLLKLFLLLLLPSIFPSIRVFCNESALLIKWPKYWSFGFSISPYRVSFLKGDLID